MRVLVACEYSGRVRDAFRRHGHDAWSCDLLECEANPIHHLQQPVEQVLADGWDLMVAHPPCTHLAVSGSRHFHRKQREQAEALDFVRLLMAAPIPRWCIENPVSIISSAIRQPDQIIQPWEHGHEQQKSTCLWLKNLPRLKPSKIVGKGDFVVTAGGNRLPAWYNLPPSPTRWKERSRTFQGIAEAMADQWGTVPLQSPVQQLHLFIS
jgi:site-specific DNA-cytosine methylase